MNTLTTPRQLAQKLGIDSISADKIKRIQRWIDSITIEKMDTDIITSERLITKQYNFSDLEEGQSLDIIRDISAAFRYLFTNTYAEFIFYPSEGRKISLQELLDLSPSTIFSIDTISSFPTDCFCKESSLDKSNAEYPLFCHDPDITFMNLKNKLGKHGHAASIVDVQNDKILGFAFGYKSSLREAWKYEEWIHPFVYSRFGEYLDKLKESNIDAFNRIQAKYVNRFDDYLMKLNGLIKDNIKLFEGRGCKNKYEPDDAVYVFNALVTHPKIRSISKPTKLGESCLSLIDEETGKNMLAIGESVFQTNAYKMFQIGGMKDIYGILNQSPDQAQAGENILMTGPLSSVLEAVSLPHREFMKRYIQFYRKAKL